MIRFLLGRKFITLNLVKDFAYNKCMINRTTYIILIIASILLLALGAYYLVDYSWRNSRSNKEVVENQDQENQSQNQKQGNEDSEEEQDLSKAQNNSVVVDAPKMKGKVRSPLLVSGKAKGSWYFEATFPVVLTDWDGKIIAETYAQAQDDWMTEEFVPFEAELTFEKSELYDRGSLILQKANPSGLPENDAALEFTIYFE